MTVGGRALVVLIGLAVAVAVLVLPRVTASGGQGAGVTIPSSRTTVTADDVEIVAIDYVPDATDPSLVSRVDVELAGTLQPTTQVDVRLSPSGSRYRCSVAGTAVGDGPRAFLRCIPDGEMTPSSELREVTVMLSTS